MIKYNLKCENSHEFESWFSDSKEFEKLKKKKLLECIYCSSKKINKSLMAPMISLAKNEKDLVKINEKIKNERQKLVKLRKYIENNFENVGKNFSKKVREIYYDKNNNKTIYGTTTLKERQDLEDEGIDLVSIPWVEKEN
tara:strand:- start:268 stop:687 length:420 start_codon:yes stop_codon:yes gene_type:complete